MNVMKIIVLFIFNNSPILYFVFVDRTDDYPPERSRG